MSGGRSSSKFDVANAIAFIWLQFYRFLAQTPAFFSLAALWHK
ncbi:hypothetical protein YPPY64_1668 [Yersinia pestis PY-64]|nr:conserved hypothetical protein [Yersinia pestis KIM D27]EIR22852.1 hypothetical protein YPPY09_1659 [Yersinia pestis PY-09]EIR34872.1 hypothetical protein YPPY10_1684 [Yersinia pestis PY-10]EIR35996.1 hypothetical protein YPPY12_1798 [Yersinia pestis PY-12]EIR36135.1 hypothetical protein YPPY11_1725 [Yersinia pestis PY-11]EIR80278.1 hypothetical protein YPPY32_1895 [Yersinia pestis PY-32]EIS20407.1 hypothetical protein YPPY52_1672 [Yersinia pestis PY-52]EIS45851.1 hypothetical protein YPP